MPQPVIGLLVPPREPFLHPDTRFFPAVRFAVEGLGIREMGVEDFDAAAGRVVEAAAELGRRGAGAIALLGTSLSFYRGPQSNLELERRIAEAAGCAAVTASTAVVEALRKTKARRLAVATAYDDTLNARLRDYLEACGFEVAALLGMNIRKVAEAMAVADSAIVELTDASRKAAPAADAVLISCGAFATAHLLSDLEQRCGTPVVSTTPATLTAALSRIAP